MQEANLRITPVLQARGFFSYEIRGRFFVQSGCG